MAIAVKPIEKRAFPVKEAAKILSTSPQMVYKLIKEGHLRAMKLPDYKIPDFEIERLMRESIEKGTSYENLLKE